MKKGTGAVVPGSNYAQAKCSLFPLPTCWIQDTVEMNSNFTQITEMDKQGGKGNVQELMYLAKNQ